MRQDVIQPIRHRPIAFFFAIAFIVSWVAGLSLVAASHGYLSLEKIPRTLLLIIFGVGPAISAFIVKSITSVDSNDQRLLSSFKPAWRNFPWIVLAIFFPLVLLLPMSIFQHFQVIEPMPEVPPSELPMVLAACAFSCIANPWEEIAWRGFALPKIQSKIGVSLASLFIGLTAGVWHLPLFWLKDGTMSSFPFLPWLIGSVAISFALSSIYNWSGQSLLCSSVLHVSLNTWFSAFGIVSFRAYAIVSMFAIFGFVVAHAIRGTSRIGRRERYATEIDEQSDPPKSPVGREFES